MHSFSGRRVMKSYKSLGDMQVVQLAPGETVNQVIEHYRTSGLVEFAEPDYKIHASAGPNDPDFVGGTQWSLRNLGVPGHDINALEGWETLNNASNVVVAIIDSGIRYTHEDLAANVWMNTKEIPGNGIDDDANGIIDDIHGINAVTSTGDPMDDAGHGTHVAGIIGAVGNNQLGIAGVAWKVQLMACKFLDSAGDGDTSDAIRCIDYARRNGAQIINASWGGTDNSTALYTAIANARAAGIIVVTAAGNESVNIDNVPLYPACYDLNNIVVVGGTGRADTMDTSYSNFGAINVDVCAPGTGIYSTWNAWDGAYTYLSGTSMAAPHVTGILALMKARFSTMTTSQLISRLYSTVDAIPNLSGKCKTGGRVNLGRALGSEPTANFSASRLTGEPPLTVNFTNLTVGELKSINWDFGDGTAPVTNSNPAHVFAQNGEFRVKLTVVGMNGRTNSVEQTIQVNSNYEFRPENFSWIEPTGMTAINLTDNGVSAAQALPFSFNFYGKSYDSIYVGANGLLSFESSGAMSTDNTTLPSSNAPNAIICPYWDNLNPAAGGSVYVGSVGEAPARRFVVSWVNVPRNSTAISVTFQAVLEEGTDQIIFQYLEVHPETPRGGGKRATIGVENATGNTAALYTYNGSPVLVTNQSAVRVKLNDYRYLTASDASIRITAIRGAANEGGTLVISNPGTLDLDWSIESGETWLDLPVKAGSLKAGENFSVPIALSPATATLAAGVYNGSLSLKNKTDGAGDVVIPVQLEVRESKSQLVLEGGGDGVFTGGLGGPFSPSALLVELRNFGNVALDWNSSVQFEWVQLHPAGGSISPGESERVEISLGNGAEILQSGTTGASIQFQNLTDAGPALEKTIQVIVRSRVEQASVVNGVFRGELEAPAGSLYDVEYSEDLQTWITLPLTPTVSGTTVRFEDPVNVGTRRFYRVRVE